MPWLEGAQPPPPEKKKSLRIVWIIVGSLLLVVGGIASALYYQAHEKYLRRSKSTEAIVNVRRLYDSAVAYFEEEHASKGGKILEKQFPVSSPMWPPGTPCDHPGKKYPVKADQWRHPSWTALNFSVDDSHYYRYQFVSKGSGNESTFTARAIGDLNCDGVWSTFERIGTVDAAGHVAGGAGLYKNQALE